MDITPYVEDLRGDLAGAARSGGPEAAEAAERLALALEPALRMVLLEALSHATAEITASLEGGSVEVRLKGREPQFVVDVPTVPMQAPAAPAAPSPPPPPGAEDDVPVEEDDSIARISLRIPESLKYKAEELAAKSGHSLNAWIVNVVRTATRERGAINVDVDLSSIPFFDRQYTGSGPRTAGRGKRMTGWV